MRDRATLIALTLWLACICPCTPPLFAFALQVDEYVLRFAAHGTLLNYPEPLTTHSLEDFVRSLPGCAGGACHVGVATEPAGFSEAAGPSEATHVLFQLSLTSGGAADDREALAGAIAMLRLSSLAQLSSVLGLRVVMQLKVEHQPRRVAGEAGWRGVGTTVAHGRSTFHHRFVLTSIDSRSGSLAGGSIVTITGDGFSDAADDMLVTIGGVDCAVVSSAFDSLVVVTPPASNASLLNATLLDSNTAMISDIQVRHVRGMTAGGSLTFEHSAAVTPTLTSLASSFDAGVWTLTLTGAGFSGDTSTMDVWVGSAICALTTVGLDSIECDTGALPAGSHPVRIWREGHGFALGELAIDVQLSVGSVTPAILPMTGGTLLTIRGNGFPTDSSALAVTVCGLPCELESSPSYSSVSCRAPEMLPPSWVGARTQTLPASTGVLGLSSGDLTLVWGTSWVSRPHIG